MNLEDDPTEIFIEPKNLTEIRIVFETFSCQLVFSLIAFDGEEEHVHLQVNPHPKLAISERDLRLIGGASKIIGAPINLRY